MFAEVVGTLQGQGGCLLLLLQCQIANGALAVKAFQRIRLQEIAIGVACGRAAVTTGESNQNHSNRQGFRLDKVQACQHQVGVFWK